MRAVIIRQHGGLEELRLVGDHPDPVPGAGEIVLKVEACALNYHDLFTLRGMPGIKVPMPIVIGIDIAGTVLEVGPDAGSWKPGDRVLLDPIDRERYKLQGEMMDGGLAEKVKVRHQQLIALPDDVSFDEAAALPVAYGTAYRMMVERGAIRKGERVLILGASGGVGTCCVQLAKLAGAEVIVAASSEEKLARLKEIGADHGINYAAGDFMKEVHGRFGKPRVVSGSTAGLDVVVNFTGGDTWVPSLRCLKRYGRVLTCGATAGYDPKEDLRFIWTFELNIVGSNGWEMSDLHALLELVRKRQLKPVIDNVYPLERAADALRAMDERRIFGKPIIRP